MSASATSSSKRTATELDHVAAQTHKRKNSTDKKTEEKAPAVIEEQGFSQAARSQLEQKLEKIQKRLTEINHQRSSLKKEGLQCEKKVQTLRTRLLKLEEENEDTQMEASLEANQKSLQENALLAKLFKDEDVYYRGIKTRITGFDKDLNQFLLSSSQEVKASKEELVFSPEKGKIYLFQDVTMDPGHRFFEARVVKIKKRPDQENNDVHCLIFWLGLQHYDTIVLTNLGSILPFGLNHPKDQDLQLHSIECGGNIYPSFSLS